MGGRVLVIGSKGMAGHVITYYLKEKGIDVKDISRNDDFFRSTYTLDVTSFKLIERIINEGGFSLIINCIGLLNEKAEQHPDRAVQLNSYFPHFLARLATANKASLIHISTDCVFNGNKGNYREDEMKDGIGFYAQSKALGEVTYSNHLTIRTSIVGPELKEEGIGLFNWFMQQKNQIQGYKETFWTGITTLELAKAIYFFATNKLPTGVLHLVPSMKISKLNLLRSFLQEIGNNRVTSIIENREYRIDKSLINTRVDVDYQVPTYESMLKELKEWIGNHAEIYQRYLVVMNYP
jgi:dTDP-4-dehydrorhamnose reductase